MKWVSALKKWWNSYKQKPKSHKTGNSLTYCPKPAVVRSYTVSIEKRTETWAYAVSRELTKLINKRPLDPRPNPAPKTGPAKNWHWLLEIVWVSTNRADGWCKKQRTRLRYIFQFDGTAGLNRLTSRPFGISFEGTTIPRPATPDTIPSNLILD